MGNIRRIKKSLNKAVPMIKTGVSFEGCEVVLAVSNPMEAKKKAERFRMFLNRAVHRASSANFADIMDVSFMVRKRLVNGEPIWN